MESAEGRRLSTIYKKKIPPSETSTKFQYLIALAKIKGWEPLFSNGARIPKYRAGTSVAFCRYVCLCLEIVHRSGVLKRRERTVYLVVIGTGDPREESSPES